ncbi:MAG: hypothetical protein IH998_08115 [Proteobacteria bacterium]|nr:hypothetical protein [Pseudomonadota bacterium]
MTDATDWCFGRITNKYIDVASDILKRIDGTKYQFINDEVFESIKELGRATGVVPEDRAVCQGFCKPFVHNVVEVAHAPRGFSRGRRYVGDRIEFHPTTSSRGRSKAKGVTG